MNKKRIVALVLTLVFSQIFYCTSFGMSLEPQETKLIIKQAWQNAFDGDYDTSRKLLYEAADKGNLKATMFLATGYTSGSLVTPQDQTQAQKCNQVLQSLKEQRKQYFIKQEKRQTLAQTRYSIHIGDLEKKVARKNSLIQGACFARENYWYTQVAAILQQEYEKKGSMCSLLPTKPFRIPAPEDGLCRLIDMHAADDLTNTRMPLIQQGIQALNNPKIYDHVLALLTSEFCIFSYMKDWQLLQCIHEGALRHGRKKELGRAYSKFILDNASMLIYTLQNDKVKNDRILTALPIYHSLNPDDAIQILDSCLKAQIKSCYSRDFYEYKSPSSSLLKYLVCMWQFSPRSFEHHATTILENKLDAFLFLALSKPQKMKLLESTSLALDRVIALTLERTLQHDPRTSSQNAAFETFLACGQQFHAAYQDHISQILPIFLKIYPRSQDPVVSLLASPLPKLRNAAFNALTEFYSSDNEALRITNSIKKFFNADLGRVLDGQNTLGALRIFYDTCKRKHSIAGVQFLWHHLADSNDQETQKFLSEMLHDFFKIEPQRPITNFSFSTMLNQALAQAYAPAISSSDIPRPNIHDFLISAKVTGLIELINPAFLEDQKNKQMLQEETPIKDRCQFLSDLLITRAQENKNFDDIITLIEQLPDSSFKAYAQSILATLKPRQTFYEYFSNQRRILEFHRHNNNFPQAPEILRVLSIGYFNGLFDRSLTQVERDAKKWVTVGRSFYDAQLHEGLLFGYGVESEVDKDLNVVLKERLYACDANDGYALWAAPVQSIFTKRNPFLVTNETVYCVTDESEILMLNKKDGSVRENSIKFSNSMKIDALHVTADNTLIVENETNVCFIDVTNNSIASYITNSIGKGFVLGNRFIFRERQMDKESINLCLLDKTGKYRLIKTLANDFIHLPYIFGAKNRLYYVTRDTKQYTLVAHDVETTHKLWEWPIPSIDLTCKPKLSKDGDKLFLLTPQTLFALRTNPEATGADRVLWKLSNKNEDSFENINKIFVDETGATLYAINGHLDRELRQINMYTGNEVLLGKVDLEKRILGTHNRKLYLAI